MNPFSIKPLALLIALVVAAAAGGGAAWTVQGWRKDTVIADLKADQAKAQAKDAADALQQFKTDAKGIHDAADAMLAGAQAYDKTATTILKGYKHENPPPPLPVDCKLDAVRLHYLQASAGAANDSFLGLRPSPALQGAPSP